jgi:hypothetical protein
MGPSRFIGALALAWLTGGCDPAESEYVARARADYAGRSPTSCCRDKCTDEAIASCAFLKDGAIVKTAVNKTQGPPGALHEVVFEVEGPNGKGRCAYHYWNTGSTIQVDINALPPTCRASARP